MSQSTFLGDDLDAKIARYGWAVLGVFGEHDAPPFAYTVGLAAKGWPELIVFGLPLDVARQFLNQLGRRLRDGEQLPLDTAMLGVAEGFPAQLVAVPRQASDQYMFATRRRYPDYRALQLVWTDKAGRFPWERAYDPQFKALQPVLRSRLH
jgi:hypothetical protein